ncbi:MAG: hypothetical protein K0S32_953 [Bacteroidetes bacterium]|nr:hypothetical protein [Bacteroidota bacterium]
MQKKSSTFLLRIFILNFNGTEAYDRYPSVSLSLCGKIIFVVNYQLELDLFFFLLEERLPLLPKEFLFFLYWSP